MKFNKDLDHVYNDRLEVNTLNCDFFHNKKNFFRFLFLFVFFLLFFVSPCFAIGDPKIVSKLQSGFEDIEGWILKLATPAAAVAVGTGIFMRKFSFGDEERIRLGKKLIRNSLFSYGFILAIDLILAAIKAIIS